MTLDPSYGEAHHWRSHYFEALSRFKEALEGSRRALQVDPLNFGIGAHQIWINVFDRHYRDAVAVAYNMLLLDPKHMPSNVYLSWAYEALGEFDQALAAREVYQPVFEVARLRNAWKTSGAPGYWQEVLKLDLENSKRAYRSAAAIAVDYARVGDKDNAFRWLDRAVAERSTWLVYLNVDPRFDSLRSDPRFRPLVERVGLPVRILY